MPFLPQRLRHRIWLRRYQRRYVSLLPEALLFADPRTEADDVVSTTVSLDRPSNPMQAASAVVDASVRDQTYWVMERLGVWIVRHADVEIASLPSRTSALTAAVLRAHEHPPSEVVILGRDGEIEEKCSFGRDPN